MSKKEKDDAKREAFMPDEYPVYVITTTLNHFNKTTAIKAVGMYDSRWLHRLHVDSDIKTVTVWTTESLEDYVTYRNSLTNVDRSGEYLGLDKAKRIPVMVTKLRGSSR